MTNTNPDAIMTAVVRAQHYVKVALTTADKWGDAGKALKRADHALSSAMDALNLTPYEKLRDAVGIYMSEVGFCSIEQADDQPGSWCSEKRCDYCNMGRALAALDPEFKERT